MARSDTEAEGDLRRTSEATAEAPVAGRLRLVIVDGDVFRTEILPASGAVTLGRSSSCDITIDNVSISRTHARITLGDELTIEDLDSANGTHIGDRTLVPGMPERFNIGDALNLGSVAVLVQKSAAHARATRIWPHGYFEGRLEEECLRSERVRGQFAVVRVAGDSDATKAIEDALASVVRGIDVIGCYAPGDYEVLLTDSTRGIADKIVERLVSQLARRGVTLRAGIACYPADARTADELIARAGHQPSSARVVATGGVAHLEALTRKVAASSISVLVLGETGAGKEVLAATIDRLSPRASKPFLALNCASLSESLLESELFGHERGAFTGAVAAKPGLLETADQGTVFLDEIGDMPLPIQVKLLRVLEDRRVMRVGAVKAREIDVRFIAATNRDLERDIQRGIFRQDLFFRLNGITLEVPPLRDRRSEIEGFAIAFATESARAMGMTSVPAIAMAALETLLDYSWPGNIRELRNVIERAVVLSGGATIEREHLPIEKMHATLAAEPRWASEGPTVVVDDQPMPRRRSRQFAQAEDFTPIPTLPPSPPATKSTAPMPIPAPTGDLRDQIDALERTQIMKAMEECGGNQKRAAAALGISRRTLINRLDAYGIPRPRKT